MEDEGVGAEFVEVEAEVLDLVYDLPEVAEVDGGEFEGSGEKELLAGKSFVGSRMEEAFVKDALVGMGLVDDEESFRLLLEEVALVELGEVAGFCWVDLGGRGFK